MLAAVLAGIALGSYAVTPLMRLRVDWLQVLAVLQFGAALAAIRSFSYLGRDPRLPRWLERFLDASGLSHLVSPVSASIAAFCQPLSYSASRFQWACGCGLEQAATNDLRPSASGCSCP